MTLPLPQLDSRRWDDLVKEALARLPRHAPGWTDYNAHDPGITLIELLAYQVEQAIYRANRVSVPLRRQFIAQMPDRRESPGGASISRFFVRFEAPRRDKAGMLPRGLILKCEPQSECGPQEDGSNEKPPPVYAQLVNDVWLTPGDIVGLESDDGRGPPQDQSRLLAKGAAFRLWGVNPFRNPATSTAKSAPNVVIRFSRPLRGGVSLYFDLESDDSAASDQGLNAGRDQPALHITRQWTRPLSVQPPVARRDTPSWDGLPDPSPDGTASGATRGFDIRWDITNPEDQAWKRATIVSDGTQGLTRTGVVQLRFDGIAAASAIRVQIVSGRPDHSPRVRQIEVNVGELNGAVPCLTEVTGPRHQHLLATSLVSCPEQLLPSPETDRAGLTVRDFLDQLVNTRHGIGPVQIIDCDNQWQLSEDGSAHVPLCSGAVLAKTCQLLSLEMSRLQPGGYMLHAWDCQETLNASGPLDRHFVVEDRDGRLRFGDGTRGYRPRPGSVLIATYRSTSGAGVLPIHSRSWYFPGITDWSRLADLDDFYAVWNSRFPIDQDINLRDCRATRLTSVENGTAVETGRSELDLALASVARRAHAAVAVAEQAARFQGTLDELTRTEILSLTAPAQALIPADFERLAFDTPGRVILRARAFPDVDPRMPGVCAPGTVGLVILPGLPHDRPVPTDALIEAVSRHLQPLRTLATRLVVASPHYAERTLCAVLRFRECLTRSERIERAAGVQRKLIDWLHPLQGGEGGRGWRFNRDVTRGEALTKLQEFAPGAIIASCDLAIDDSEFYPWSFPCWKEVQITIEEQLE